MKEDRFPKNKVLQTTGLKELAVLDIVAENNLCNIGAMQFSAKAAKRIVENETALQLYDLSALRRIGKGNAVFAEKMVHVFIEQIPLIETQMLKSYYQEDYKTMCYFAHKMKYSFEIMGMKLLKDTIVEIERLGKFETKSEALTALLDIVKTTLLQVVSLLKNEYPITRLA